MLAKLWKLRDEKKKSGKGGFTLVELIVVLVILAILAALLIPALTGYIDKAKEKQIIAETRQAVMAAQTLADEYTGTLAAGSYAASNNISVDSVKSLAEVSGTITIDKVTASGKIEQLTYTSGGKKCVYSISPAAGSSKYSVGDTTP